MLTIKLTDQDRNNLVAFLERVDMKGKEALAYLRILQALEQAEELEEKEGD